MSAFQLSWTVLGATFIMQIKHISKYFVFSYQVLRKQKIKRFSLFSDLFNMYSVNLKQFLGHSEEMILFSPTTAIFKLTIVTSLSFSISWML